MQDKIFDLIYPAKTIKPLPDNAPSPNGAMVKGKAVFIINTGTEYIVPHTTVITVPELPKGSSVYRVPQAHNA